MEVDGDMAMEVDSRVRLTANVVGRGSGKLLPVLPVSQSWIRIRSQSRPYDIVSKASYTSLYDVLVSLLESHSCNADSSSDLKPQ